MVRFAPGLTILALPKGMVKSALAGEAVVRLAIKALVLQEHYRIVAADGGAQQATRRPEMRWTEKRRAGRECG